MTSNILGTTLSDIQYAVSTNPDSEQAFHSILKALAAAGPSIGMIIDPVTDEVCVDALRLVQERGLLHQGVLDHGYVDVLDVMPRLLPLSLKSGDFALASAARGSYQKGTKQLRSDAGLVDYLVRKLHTSPIEMAELKFGMRMPIFVARQFVRHRTASLNEESARYSVLSSDFYIPEPSEWRVNTADNRQATVDAHLDKEPAERLSDALRKHCEAAYDLYEAYLASPDDEEAYEGRFGDIAQIAGVGRELARMVLPLNIYTRWVWKCDLKNLLHLLKLRCDSHAQKEIRVYAEAIARIVNLLFPAAWNSWEDNFMLGVNFSGTEANLLQRLFSGGPTDFVWLAEELGWSKRRQGEFIDKAAQIGIAIQA